MSWSYIEPKCPDIWRQSPKTNCFTHGLLLTQNSSIDNYCNKINTSCRKHIINFPKNNCSQNISSKVYINSEWLLNINYKSISTLYHGLRGGKDWLSFLYLRPSLSIWTAQNGYPVGSEVAYTNLAWARKGRQILQGQNYPKSSAIMVVRRSCYSARTYFNQKES